MRESIKRKDSKGRILRDGEQQRKDGRYMYIYQDSMTGKKKYLYSWKLEPRDKAPAGRKNDLSLREKIRDLQKEVAENGGYFDTKMTVLELVEQYIETKEGVRPTTKNGYRTVVSCLKQEEFGKKAINKVTVLDAKKWFVGLQKNGRGYSSIHSIRGVLRPAFALAVESDYIRKNPFDFELKNVIVNDSVKRQALDSKVEAVFLEFVKKDERFAEYYDGMFILLRTGLRISEFCGLTIRDIDMQKKLIHVDHQLQTTGHKGKYIETTKTNAGKRVLPMTEEVYAAFHRVLSNRKAPKVEQVIDGYSGFVFLDSRGMVMMSYQWEKRFKQAVEKYNKTHKIKLPSITPHVCRHTYCTNMVKKGISQKSLQYLMGHSSIEVTMDIYTHLGLEDVKKELEQVDACEEIRKIDEDSRKRKGMLVQV